MKRSLVLLAIAACLALAPALGVERNDVKVTGLFSNLSQHPETGDIVGREVFIVSSGQGRDTRYHALVQFAEGAPTPPQLVEAVIKDKTVTFVASYLGVKTVTFLGTLSAGDLSGAFVELGEEVRLERRQSFWQ